MINPGGIPQYEGIPSEITAAAEALRASGQSFADSGSGVHAAWQGLAGYYQAPEAAQLFAATQPVSDRTAIVSSEISLVSDALVTFAETMVPIKWRLAELQTEARNFVNSVEGDDDWADDEDKVDEHNALLTEVQQLLDRWQTAERDAANSINAAYGAEWRWVEDNGDDNVDPHEYGYDSSLYADADEEGVELPWGNSEDVNPNALQSFGNFLHGVFVDGLWGDIQGLGAFFGTQGGDAAAAAWTNLGVLGTMLTPSGLIAGIANPQLGQQQRDVWSNLRDGMIASDLWEDDPARAFGNVLWNFGSLAIGGAGAVAKASKLGRVAEIAGTIATTADRFSVLSLTERFLATRPGIAASVTRFSDLVSGGLDVTFRTDDVITTGSRVDLPSHSGVSAVDANHNAASHDITPSTADNAAPYRTPGSEQVGMSPPNGGPAYEAFESPHAYSDGAHAIDAEHPATNWSETIGPSNAGRFAEYVTEADLRRQGFDVLFSGRHVNLPDGSGASYFVPDFIVRDPLSGDVFAVESKYGSSAAYEPNQMIGYTDLADQGPLTARAARVQDILDAAGVDQVDGVITYRWNTEVVPDAQLIDEARALIPENSSLWPTMNPAGSWTP